jgi:hypothetical protein
MLMLILVSMLTLIEGVLVLELDGTEKKGTGRIVEFAEVELVLLAGLWQQALASALEAGEGSLTPVPQQLDVGVSAVLLDG